MRKCSISFGLVLAFVGCASRPTSQATRTTTAAVTQPSEMLSPRDWTGVYMSPSEIGTFHRTILTLIDPDLGEHTYLLRQQTDMVVVGTIPQDVFRGQFAVEGPRLFLPIANGMTNGGQPSLSAHLDRYTRIVLNGRIVLMRDDALRVFRTSNQLYDYGILIKVPDNGSPFQDLQQVQQESIKVLYADPSKPWQDPFVP